MKRACLFVSVVLLLAGSVVPVQAAGNSGDLQTAVLEKLQKLPHYGVFDNLAIQLAGNNVTLLGQVLLPNTRHEAVKRVSAIAGIGTVTDRIEVLPVSRLDDQLRMRVYRQLFGAEGLYRYAMGPTPSIHIVVKGGRVSLEGRVSSAEDAQLALMVARRTPGLLACKSNPQVGD
jgi:osmotically-inducible protein OsmY